MLPRWAFRMAVSFLERGPRSLRKFAFELRWRRYRRELQRYRNTLPATKAERGQKWSGR